MKTLAMVVIAMSAFVAQGCLAVKADVQLIVRDSETGKELHGCYLAVGKESQTMISTLFTQMPKNLGTDREVDIHRIDSGYRYRLLDLSVYYVFFGPIYTVTDSKWTWYLFCEGYVPVHLASKDLLYSKQQKDQFVIEMKRYSPRIPLSDAEALFNAANDTWWYKGRVAWGDGRAKPVWALLADMTEASLTSTSLPTSQRDGNGPQASPSSWWTRERVEHLAKELRELSTE